MKSGGIQTFREAVTSAPEPVASAWQPGLQALGSDSHRVRCSDTRRLTGSIALDETLRESYPEEPRWDYGIGLRRSEQEVAIWVEVHPARTDEIDSVLSKLRWLKSWLAHSAPSLNAITPHAESPFYWVASGEVHISRNSPQARRLAVNGVHYPVRVLHL